MTRYAALRPEIVNTVQRCVADSLAIEPEQVNLGSRLIDDLGASSLDFIDIVFMLEKDLGIKVRESEFSFLTRLDFTSPEVMKDGVLTSQIVDKLEGWLPAMADVEDKNNITPRQLFSLITVEAIALVAQKQVDALKS